MLHTMFYYSKVSRKADVFSVYYIWKRGVRDETGVFRRLLHFMHQRLVIPASGV